MKRQEEIFRLSKGKESKFMKKICILILAMLVIIAGCGKEKSKMEEAVKNPSEVHVEVEETEREEFGKVDPKAEKDIIDEETVLGDYTSEFLSQYVAGGTYYIVQNSIKDGKVTKVEIAVKGDKAAERIGTQVKFIDGDKLYYVIHDSKAVLTSPVADSMKEGFTDFISVNTSEEAKSALQNTGEEEFQGEKFGFEEFKNADGTVTKFYYDDKTLRYVKVNKNGAEEIIQVIELSTKVPADIFDVPDGYIVKDISNMQ